MLQTLEMQPAIILFAHGARDERWAEPFRLIAERVRETAPDLVVELAFLEHLPPDLSEAARRVVAKGATAIRVVPLFFGRGGHLRLDVPQLIAGVEAGLPGIAIELALPAGEDGAVIDAIATFCVR